jgi:hypothetical protein
MMTSPLKYLLWTLPVLFCAFSVLGAEKEVADKKEENAAADARNAKTAQKSDTQPKEKKNIPDEQPQTTRRESLVWRATIKVTNPDDVRMQLKKEAEALGGFLMFFNKSSISLKIPPSALTALTEKVGKMGFVLIRTMNREDLTLRIAELEGMLKSKREVFERTRKFLDNSDVSAALEVEQSMTDLLIEIEELQGTLRVLRDKVAFAVVDVSFEFRDRDKIVYVRSPFEWLNTVDLDRFNKEF